MRNLFLGILIAFQSIAAFGDFVSGATGFTTLKNPTTGEKIPGIINFGVLDQRGSRYGDSWATRYDHFDLAFKPGVDALGQRSPRLDTQARYVYLYQLTNEGKEMPFEAAAISLVIHPSLITSWGHFPNLGFADNKKQTSEWTEVSATNTFGYLDPQAPAGSASFIVYYPKVVAISGGADPGLNPHEVLLGTNAVRASWLGGEIVTPGRRGTLFGFTSDYPPGFMPGHVVMQCGGEGQPPCP